MAYASVRDDGARRNLYTVIGVVGPHDLMADYGQEYLTVSAKAAEKINEILVEGNIPFIPKGQKFKLTPKQVTSSDYDEMHREKMALMHKADQRVSSMMTSISQLTMFSFTILNNYFMDKGYIITEENREEKYLAMLNTGDEALISKLEEYLNLRDEVQYVSNDYHNYKIAKVGINEASTLEKAQVFLDQYLLATPG